MASFMLSLTAFWSTWWKAFLGAAIVAPVVLLLGIWWGTGIGKAKVENSNLRAAVQSQTRTITANEKASTDRLSDQLEIIEAKQDLTHAVEALPDTTPSARRLALGCARLRQQGTDTSRLAACSGPSGQAQAPAVRR